MPDRADAEARARLAAAQAAAERQRAQELIDEFIAEAGRRGLDPVPLEAQAGRSRVRTDKSGWYLRRNHTLAIGTDGGYYILSVAPVGMLGRLRGMRLEPTDPRLTVGRGGRDGESGPLREFLERALSGL